MTEEELTWIERLKHCDVIPADIDGLVAEIRRLRSELASERTSHQELWQMVDRELDRIYCDAKGIDQ